MRQLSSCLTHDDIEPLPSLRQMGEDDLSTRLGRMQTEAWETLYLDHRRLVRGVLASYLGYVADLEDVTQEVFERALDLVASGKVRPSGDASGMRAWLVAIALRLARAERRRRAKHRSDRRAAEFEPAAVTSGLDPESWQVLRRAQALLAKLPERLRVPWVLRHLEHMTLEEVAASTGVSLATVKRHLTQANTRFARLARCDAVLREHLTEGGGS